MAKSQIPVMIVAGAVAGLFIGMLVLMSYAFLIMRPMAEANRQRRAAAARQPAAEKVISSFDAMLAAEKHVRRQLKHPHDAKFNPGFGAMPQAQEHPDGSWTVSGLVEAKNDLGGQLTQAYVVKMDRELELTGIEMGTKR